MVTFGGHGANGKKVLIVDDDPEYLPLLEMTLKKRGFAVVAVCNGEVGFERSKSEKPDLVVFDIKMPKMDGYTFLRRLRKDPETKDIPAIVLTAYEPLKDLFRWEGASGFFLKSSPMKELLKLIEENLNL